MIWSGKYELCTGHVCNCYLLKKKLNFVAVFVCLVGFIDKVALSVSLPLSFLSFPPPLSHIFLFTFSLSASASSFFPRQNGTDTGREGGPFSSSFSTSHVCLSRIFRFSPPVVAGKYNKEGGKKESLLCSLSSLFGKWPTWKKMIFQFSLLLVFKAFPIVYRT